MAILLLKKAALLRVDIQREAIDAGFTLRDGTAFNVLFEGVRVGRQQKWDSFRA
jgi:hypothetical protein